MKLCKVAIAGAALAILIGIPGAAEAASTNLYLMDNGSPSATMGTNRPSGGSGGSRHLPPSSAGGSEKDPAKFQEWSYQLSNMTVSINEFTIWIAPADPSGEGTIALSVDILDCGSTCVRLAGGTRSLSGVVSPTKITIPVTVNGHDFGDSHDLSVKVTVPSTSSRDVTIYYASKNRDSNLHLSAVDTTPPTTTTTMTATTVAPTTTVTPTTVTPTTSAPPTTTPVTEESTFENTAPVPTTTTTAPPSPEAGLQDTDIRTRGPHVIQMADPPGHSGLNEPRGHGLTPQEGMLIFFSTAVEAFRLYWQVALGLGTVMAILLIAGFSRLELPRPKQNPFERIRPTRG